MDKEIKSFDEIFSFESLFRSFKEFEKSKKYKTDVLEFKTEIISNLFSLHLDVINGNYKHGGYFHFKVSDPKPRDIHKASVRDRVLHHAIYRALYPYFDSKFIFDSYSCRVGKGAHMALKRFEKIARTLSFNHTKTLWVLKCDIRKCFASVDQDILKKILRRHILCVRTDSVVDSVIDSFNSGVMGKGIPLGNLTSQLFINIYMNIFDHFVKRELKVKNYIRYADDFVLFSRDKIELEKLLSPMKDFLERELKLEIHPEKMIIQTIASGVDFLGWVHFPKYRVLRTKTKKRMLSSLRKTYSQASLASYIGLLGHGNAYGLEGVIRSFMLE